MAEQVTCWRCRKGLVYCKCPVTTVRLHPDGNQWQYSRNQLRHEVVDGEIYKHAGDFFQLFEIRANRSPFKIRQSSDTHRLLHMGKMVAEGKSIKALKELAAHIHNGSKKL